MTYVGSVFGHSPSNGRTDPGSSPHPKGFQVGKQLAFAPIIHSTMAEVPNSGFTKEDHPDSDIILRSVDNVDFHVHRNQLRLLSGTFDDMLKVGSASAAPAENVVSLSETSSTLVNILPYFYANLPTSAVLHNRDLPLQDLVAAYIAFDKYDIQGWIGGLVRDKVSCVDLPMPGTSQLTNVTSHQ